MPAIPQGMTIKEYNARHSQRRRARAIKRRHLIRTGQMSSLGLSYWLEKLSTIAKEYVRLRDKLTWFNATPPGICRICGLRPIQCAYHIIPAQKHATKYDPENMVGACFGCNKGEMLHRLDYADKHRQIFGNEFYEKLKTKSKLPWKPEIPWVKAEINRIRNLMEKEIICRKQ